MTFVLIPELVGCGRKIPRPVINSVSQNLKLPFGADAAPLGIGGLTLFTSIDRIGRFCSSLDLFASLAVKHFITDLIACDASPCQMSLCLEFGPEVGGAAGISDLTSAFVSAIVDHGMEVGNLHSVSSEYTAVTACVVGISSGRQFSLPTAGKVFLSDYLGAFKALVIGQLDSESVTGKSAFDGRLFLGELPPMISAASDVTGFGLLGTLENLGERHGVQIQASVSTALAFHRDVLEVPIACIDGGRPGSASGERVPAASKLINMSEVAGPMVILCNADQEVEFASWFKSKTSRLPIEIGSFSKSTSPSVRISYS